MNHDGDYLTLLRGGRFLLCVRYVHNTCILALWSTATGQQRFAYRGSGEVLGFDRDLNTLLLWDDEPRVHEIRTGRRLTITPAVIDSFELDQRLRAQLITGERARPRHVRARIRTDHQPVSSANKRRKSHCQ